MFSHAGYDALHRRSGLLDRSDRGRILLTGADRQSYLQGLLTNDIAALSPRQGCYAALLTPQGRMISDMRVSELGDAVLVDLPAETAEAVRQRFADFVFAEDVEVHDAAARLAQFGLYGPLAVDVLVAAVPGEITEGAESTEEGTEESTEEGTESTGKGTTRSHGDHGAGLGGSRSSTEAEDPGIRRERLDNMPLFANVRLAFRGEPVVVVRSDDYGIAGYELFVDAALKHALMEACRAAGAVPVSAATLAVTRIEAGRPEFGIDMDEGTIPLEAGIEDRAISLTKGCYVGQEIIIRVLHRGHGRVARKLVGLAADPAAGEMSRGERLYRDGREIGVVTSAALSPRLQRPIGLGYVHRDHAGPGTGLDLSLDRGGARRVTVVSLPFAAPAG